MKSVSVILPTFNSIRTIKACLESIHNQDYPGQVEVIGVDGGSQDGTREKLKESGVKVIKESSGSPETAKAIGLKKAKGELVLLMASDNVLPNKWWLKQMVDCLEKESQAVGAYPWRYAYKKQDSSLNRYFSLMGVNDPLAWWLNKADRQEWGETDWKLRGKAKDKGKYFLVEFNKKNMPTLGDNGMLVWREKLLKAKVDNINFSHIDVFYDLVILGMSQFVVVKKTIEHNTGETWGRFLVKRYKYLKNLYLKKQPIRRYRWGEDWQDKLRIGLFAVYSLTLVGPLLFACRRWQKQPDWAWFWHPLICWGLTVVYGLALIL